MSHSQTRKETLAGQVDRYIAQKKGRRLSAVADRLAKIEVCCENGHHFQITPRAMLSPNLKRWCRTCKNQENNAKRRWTPEKLNALAAKMGGRCLTENYKHAHQPLTWECGNGHRFTRSVSSFKENPTCPICKKARNEKKTQEKHFAECSAICQKQGGACKGVFKDPESGTWMVTVECEHGHTTTKSCHELRKGIRCQPCHITKMVSERYCNKLGSLETYQKLAEERGDKLLSTRYTGIHEKLDYLCQCGEPYSQKPAHTLAEHHGCKACNTRKRAERRRTPIEEIKAEAQKRGGDCLSESYDHSKTPLLFTCHNPAHPLWKALWSKVKIGQWCPDCGSGFGERVVRRLFDQIFGLHFPKVRPAWLKSPRKGLLELDGYNEQLAIAFEHQGRQHYEIDPFFNADKQKLDYQKERDQIKREECRKRNITLIEVPEVGGLLPLPEVAAFVLNQLEEAGVTLPVDPSTFKFNWYPAYSGNNHYRHPDPEANDAAKSSSVQTI